MNSPNEDIIHDDEIASFIHRIISAQVVYKMIEDDEAQIRNQKAYELKVEITAAEMLRLCTKIKKEFLAGPGLLRIAGDSPIIVVADLHGQVVHLLRILQACGPPPGQRYLFLGDYVDRGVQGILVITLLFSLKYRYPNHVFLLRGNHEDVNTTLNYGFYEECIIRFDTFESKNGEQVWRSCMEVFNTMPLAAIIGSKVFCSHGGISPFMTNMSDIDKVQRPLIVPPYGIACDLLWSDPAAPEREGWCLSHRGISFTYGYDVVEDFCKTHGISLIIRGHQLFRELYATGYIVRFGGYLISLFSAVNYENHRNNAAVIKLEFTKTVQTTPIVFRCRHYLNANNAETFGHRDYEVMKKLSK